MKVNIYETVQVSDEQRVAIAREIDGDGAKKRQATRDEIKDFIWSEGRNWESSLASDDDGVPEEDGPEVDDEDLLG